MRITRFNETHGTFNAHEEGGLLKAQAPLFKNYVMLKGNLKFTKPTTQDSTKWKKINKKISSWSLTRGIIYAKRCKWDNTSHTRLLFDYFVGIIPRIFLKNLYIYIYILNHIILLMFMLKIWQNMSFWKKFKSICKSFCYLKANVTMFKECLCLFFIHWINFNIKLNYDFKIWKNQANVALVMVHVIMATP